MVALGLVLGFVLGGLAPRAQLAQRERELAALKKRAERFDRPNVLSEFFPAFGRRDAPRPAAISAQADQRDSSFAAPKESESAAQVGAGARPTSAGSDRVASRAKSPVNAPTSVAGDVPGADDRPRSEERGADGASEVEGRRPALDMADFDKLVAVQRLRIAASRSALIEQAGLNDQEVAQLDRSVAKMNDQLAGYGEELLQQATGDEIPAASQVLGLGHDVSGIMLEGQQDIDKVLGGRAETVDREAKEIWNYIDVDHMRSAAEQLLPKANAPGTPRPAEEDAP